MIHKPEISLFHHPTTTVFVDDSDEFLYSVALGVDRLPYRSFSRPHEAIRYVNRFSGVYDQPARPQSPHGATLSKLLAQVESKLGDHRRFAEPSVLVVDYSMPGMNGLDLCSEVTNPNVKKVLLTGVANEKLAIEALNNALIDFYIRKTESMLSQRLRDIINHLETRYFQDLFGWRKDGEVRSKLPQLFDPAFADYFEETLEELDAVEHYPLMGPSGFYLVDAYGLTHHLAVYSEEELGEFAQHADLSRLTDSETRALRAGEMVPYRLPHQCPAADLTAADLYPATRVEGEQSYLCALVRDPESRSASVTNFQQFLKTPHGYFRDENDSRAQ